MDRLKDKVALVTEAARGQGRGMAELFMKEAARAVISTDVLDATNADKSPVTFLKQDVTKADQSKLTVEKIIADHGKIDILINNAAICLYEPILETTNEIYDRVLDIDLKSIFVGMKEVLPHMIKRKQGSIICRAISIRALGSADIRCFTVFLVAGVRTRNEPQVWESQAKWEPMPS
jgi:cyclopentanol dehydrogenase